MVKYLSAEVCERDHDLNYQPWTELFMLELGKVSPESLLQTRQLALDLGESSVEELFALEIGDGDASDLTAVMTKLSPGSDQVRAFLAAKELLGLPLLLSNNRCMCFALFFHILTLYSIHSLTSLLCRIAPVASRPPAVTAEIKDLPMNTKIGNALRCPSIKALASKSDYRGVTVQLLSSLDLCGALSWENAGNKLTNDDNGWTKCYNILCDKGEENNPLFITLKSPSDLKRKALALLQELRNNPEAPPDLKATAIMHLNRYEEIVKRNKERGESATMKDQDRQRKMRAIEFSVGAIPSGCTKAWTQMIDKNLPRKECPEARLCLEGVNLLGSDWDSAWSDILSEYDRAAHLRGKNGGGKAQHSTSLRLGENPAAVCSVESYSKAKNGANTKQATTKRGGDQAIDLTETESVEEGATKRCKHSNGLTTSASTEMIDLTGGLETLEETIGELKHQREMQLTAAIESAMTKFVPAAVESAMTNFVPSIVAAFAATQKMQQADSVPSKKEDNEDNLDESDSE
jgi:hypothetical protein